jgi:hypothetical protein
MKPLNVLEIARKRLEHLVEVAHEQFVSQQGGHPRVHHARRHVYFDARDGLNSLRAHGNPVPVVIQAQKKRMLFRFLQARLVMGQHACHCSLNAFDQGSDLRCHLPGQPLELGSLRSLSTTHSLSSHKRGLGNRVRIELLARAATRAFQVMQRAFALFNTKGTRSVFETLAHVCPPRRALPGRCVNGMMIRRFI